LRIRESGSFLATAYSHTELDQKQFSLGRVLIFGNGVGSWLEKSIRYQPIKGLPFIRLQIIRGPFCTPSPTKSQRMASSSLPMVKASVI
jgi:hypothetical protein